MEVCCLKMASRCRPPRPVVMNVTRLPTVGSSHDCGSLSRVVMVRKRDQRVINHKGQGDPQCEIVTLETIQTYKGHKPERTVVIRETRDGGSHMTQSFTTSTLITSSTNNSNTIKSGLENLTLSSNDVSFNSTSNSNSRHSSPNPSTKSVSGNKPTNLSLRHKSPSPTPAKRSSYNEFEVECLKEHNEYRAKHGVEPLKLNRKLCRFAEEWAKVISSRGNPTHRNNSPYGENIFCSWSSSSDLIVNGREPVEHWYSEFSNHIFGKEPATLKTGHFTQVVWRDSRELGVGLAKNRSGQVFVVANYDPPGNFIGSFAENVPPIGGFTTPTKSPPSSVSIVSPTTRFPVQEEFDDFGKAILKHHNEYRKKHGVQDLKLSKNLMQTAEEWAKKLANEDRFAHRPNSMYGENIYCLWSSDRNATASPKDVCRSWYEEIKEYTFGIEPRGIFKAGHFTQLVWKTSEELGVGVAKTQKGKVLVVCNYHPRGNIIGQFNANVLRPKI